MTQHKKKTTKNEFNKKTKNSKVKPKASAKKKAQKPAPYTGGSSWCSTMTRGQRRDYHPGESW